METDFNIIMYFPILQAILKIQKLECIGHIQKRVGGQGAEIKVERKEAS